MKDAAKRAGKKAKDEFKAKEAALSQRHDAELAALAQRQDADDGAQEKAGVDLDDGVADGGDGGGAKVCPFAEAEQHAEAVDCSPAVPVQCGHRGALAALPESLAIAGWELVKSRDMVSEGFAKHWRCYGDNAPQSAVGHAETSEGCAKHWQCYGDNATPERRAETEHFLQRRDLITKHQFALHFTPGRNRAPCRNRARRRGGGRSRRRPRLSGKPPSLPRSPTLGRRSGRLRRRRCTRGCCRTASVLWTSQCAFPAVRICPGQCAAAAARPPCCGHPSACSAFPLCPSQWVARVLCC